MLEATKEPTDGLLLFGHTQLEEFTALFEDLNLLEVIEEEAQDANTVDLSLKELKQVAQAHSTLFVEVSLLDQVVADAVGADLVQDQSVDSLRALFDSSLKIDLSLQIGIEA